MKRRKVVLINPPSLWKDDPIIPIGLEIIACYIEARKKEHAELAPWEIAIIDGGPLSLDETLKLFDGIADADIVGISSWQSGHQLSMQLLREIKNRAPDVKCVVGGPNVYHLSKQILRRHDYVDYAVRGPGEEALLGLLLGKSPDAVPNLVYRSNGAIVASRFQDSIDVAGRGAFHMEHVVNKSDYREYAEFPLANVLGCINASVEKRRCSFCSIPLAKTRVSRPKAFWEQIRQLRDRYGITRFFETGDSFVVGDYAKRVAAAKPPGLDVALKIYASPGQLDDASIADLTRIGVREVFIGVENVNPEIARNFSKHPEEHVVFETLDKLERSKLGAMVPYMYGLPGESRATLRRSAGFLRELVARHRKVLSWVSCNVVVPIAGSALFLGLAANQRVLSAYRDQQGEDLSDTDVINYPLLQRLMIGEARAGFSFDELSAEVDAMARFLAEQIKVISWSLNA